MVFLLSCYIVVKYWCKFAILFMAVHTTIMLCVTVYIVTFLGFERDCFKIFRDIVSRKEIWDFKS